MAGKMMVYTDPPYVGTVTVTNAGYTNTVDHNTAVNVIAGPLTMKANPPSGYVFAKWVNTWDKPGYPGQMSTSAANPLNDSVNATGTNEVFTAYFTPTNTPPPPPPPGDNPPPPTQLGGFEKWLPLAAVGIGAYILFGGKRKRR